MRITLREIVSLHTGIILDNNSYVSILEHVSQRKLKEEQIPQAYSLTKKKVEELFPWVYDIFVDGSEDYDVAILGAEEKYGKEFDI
jgi:hypothetical protein